MKWLKSATEQEEYAFNNFTQWKNGSVEVTITRRAITQQKDLSQYGRTTRSALYIFNTLRVYTKDPIREQETR